MKQLITVLPALCAALVIGLLLRSGIPVADAWSPLPISTGGHALIHLGHNAWLSFSGDPLLHHLTGEAPDAAAVGTALITGIGCWLLLIVGCGLRPLGALAGALLPPLLILFLYGSDRVVLSTICWVPWLMTALVRSAGGGPSTGPWYILTLFFAFRVAQASPHLGLIAVLLAALGAGRLLSTTRRAAPLGIGVLLALLPAAFALWHAPAAPFPDYLHHARLVPDDGLPGYLRPLVGAFTALPVIDRQMLRAAFPGAALIILAIALIAGRARPPLLPAGTLAALALLDTILPESLAQSAPLGAISRVMPNLFLFPAVSLTVALAILFLYLNLAAHRRAALSGALTVALLAAPALRPSFTAGRFLPPNAEATRTSATPEITLSPSHALVRDTGEAVALTPPRGRWVGAGALGVTITASHRGEDVPAILDRDPATRWSSGRGHQQGDEWLELRLPQPRSLLGIDLSPGNFQADFPRGIRVAPCGGSPLVDLPSWQGELRRTPAGYPWYGAQDRVVIRFPAAVMTDCLRVEQRARGAPFDWSVAGVRLLLPRR